MRGMIKWKPFNSLLNSNDIKELEKRKEKKEKPILMIDRINEINYLITKSIKEKTNLEVKHYKNDLFYITRGKIEKINTIEKYILIDNTRIYFKNIILVKEL